MAIFNCPAWGIGITSLKVYSSFFYPNFYIQATTLRGTQDILLDDNCHFLSLTLVPVNAAGSANIYFIEFLFTGGSSSHPLNWLHLGEMSFSDELPIITTTEGTTTINEGKK